MCSGRFPGDWRKKPGSLCRMAFQPETRPAEKAAHKPDTGEEEKRQLCCAVGRVLPFFETPEGFVPVSGVGKPGRTSMKKERRV